MHGHSMCRLWPIPTSRLQSLIAIAKGPQTALYVRRAGAGTYSWRLGMRVEVMLNSVTGGSSLILRRWCRSVRLRGPGPATPSGLSQRLLGTCPRTLGRSTRSRNRWCSGCGLTERPRFMHPPSENLQWRIGFACVCPLDLESDPVILHTSFESRILPPSVRNSK
ncbi:hypothetical protein LX32DRAFT_349022 [Colletotrichum zoysiae]|uniref:Uncharacterized protein n=1 Tax=Colletotrichum zoysiae TaxID=1216348 RepID=A0AAD9HIT5_9PEZI|nr:hypothetical protein LX32DRAFT_349022 [Colletotrichum zoysiae]